MATCRVLTRSTSIIRSYGLLSRIHHPLPTLQRILFRRHVFESLPKVTASHWCTRFNFNNRNEPIKGTSRPVLEQHVLDHWLRLSSEDSSDDDNKKRKRGRTKNKNDDDGEDDGDKGGREPNYLWVGFLGISLLYMLSEIYNVRRYALTGESSEEILRRAWIYKNREISLTAFISQMVGKGVVEYVKVFKEEGPKNKEGVSQVEVHLRQGSTFDGELIASSGPHFWFKIASLQSFETALLEAQERLGIDPEDRIPIWYRIKPSLNSDYSRDVSKIAVTAVLAAVIAILLRFARFSTSTSIMKNSPMSSMTRAKSTIVNPGSKGAVKMKDVAGMKEAKEEIQEFVAFLRDPERFKRLGAKMPKGALLTGPPGTGKTLLAKAVSAEAGVPFLSMAGSDFVEIVGGVGAGRVRDLFRQAHKRAPCIVYIDEVDAIGRARRSGNDSGGGGGSNEYEQTLNQLLVEMDGMNTSGDVVILASTNRPDVLDNALLRPGRFDRQIIIDLPTLPERKEIFEVYLKKLKLSRLDNVTSHYAKRLAELTPGKSGADIANVCNEAAIHAARMDQSDVDQENFEYAIERVIAGLESKNNSINPLEQRTIAYHEAGHVVVSWMLEHTEPVLKISTRPRNSSPFGFKQEFPLDRNLQTNEQLFSMMCTLLGGRISEHIVFGRVTTGAEDDLDRVTSIAYQQIVTFGMNENIGPMSFPVYRRGEATKKPYSDALAREIDVEVSRTLADVHIKTTELLEANRGKLDVLASALLENEVLNYDDLVRLLGPSPYGDKMKKFYSTQLLSDVVE